MNLNFLPNNILSAINRLDLICLNEIRLRKNFPIKVVLGFRTYYLSESGATSSRGQALICTEYHIKTIVDIVTDHSLYAHMERIKEGYIAWKNGIRIGIGGEYIFEKGEVITVKNITSLNVRIPHDVIGCADDVFDKLFFGGIQNSLIISPPMQGKTTILKEIIRKLSDSDIGTILVVDERGEFINVKGDNIDFISYADKQFAFNFGVRTMSPKIIITDELVDEKDWKCVLNSVNCGVKVVASCHAESVDELIKKNYFIKNVFNRYVVLGSVGGIASDKIIYDGDFNII